jgi:hypothetical protein
VAPIDRGACLKHVPYGTRFRHSALLQSHRFSTASGVLRLGPAQCAPVDPKSAKAPGSAHGAPLFASVKPTGIGPGRHQHVRFDPWLCPVPEGAHFHLALQLAEGRLGFGQWHVGLPESCRVAPDPASLPRLRCRQVRAPQIRPLGPRALLELPALPVPCELQAPVGFRQLPPQPAPRWNT